MDIILEPKIFLAKKTTERNKNYISLIAKKNSFLDVLMSLKKIEPVMNLSISKILSILIKKRLVAGVSIKKSKTLDFNRKKSKNGAKTFKKNHRIVELCSSANVYVRQLPQMQFHPNYFTPFAKFVERGC